MKRSQCLLWFVLVLTTCCLTSACASHKAAQLPQLAFDLKAQQDRVETEGISFMVKPIYLKGEQERYFDCDLLSDGILPVQVHVNNSSHNGPITFRTDGINLINSSGDRAPVMSMEQVLKHAQKSYGRAAGWGIAFGIFGLIPSIINVSSTNQEIQAEYESRMLKGGNIVPGAMTEGVAFFSVPPDLCNLNGWKISLIVMDNALQSNDETAGDSGATQPEAESPNTVSAGTREIILEQGLYGTWTARPPKDEPLQQQKKEPTMLN